MQLFDISSEMVTVRDPGFPGTAWPAEVVREEVPGWWTVWARGSELRVLIIPGQQGRNALVACTTLRRCGFLPPEATSRDVLEYLDLDPISGNAVDAASLAAALRVILCTAEE